MAAAIAAVAVTVCVLLSSHAPARSTGNLNSIANLVKAPHAPSRLIVRYSPEVSVRGRQAVAAGYKWRTIYRLERVGYDVVELEGMSVEAALATVAGDDRIAYAEPDYRVTASEIPNDTFFDNQWGMHNTGQNGGTPDADIDAVEAWDVGTGKTVLVAIIDTGIDDEHADLRDRLWVNPGEIPGNGIDDDHNGYVDDIHGWDFLYNDNDPYDDNGHGTHVAGVIAAVANNEIGIAGVCSTARVMPLKFLDADGYGYTSDAVLALEYAADMGAILSNNSWGSTGNSLALRDAIDSVGQLGMLCVIAAGNKGTNNDAIPYYPAAYDLDNIIAVAATDRYDSLATEDQWASNYGRRSVDLAAPGVQIYSTIPGSAYGYMSGTSMATPSVTGTAALVWSLVPSLSAVEVRGRILQSVDRLPWLLNKCATGGRLNAYSALASIEAEPPAAVTDLTVVGVKSSSATLRWTAPGDDGVSGQAATYDLRVSKWPIDSTNFLDAEQVEAVPPPREPGTVEQFTVEQLDFSSTYYFAVRTVDDWYNAGLVSNAATATTLGPPSVQVTPTSISDSLHAGGYSEHSLYVANLGSGELRYQLRGVYNYDRSSRDDVFGAAAADIGIKDVLLLYADGGAGGLKSILESYPDIGRVDLWQAGVPSGTIPSAADLRAYDVVVAWNNFVWADLYDIGDVLADLVDSGGSVVTLVDCWANKQFSSFGRYFTDPHYSPFVSTGRALFDVRTLGEYQATHPLMRGVDSLVISMYYNQVELAPDAQGVAYWDNGMPLVATQGHNVAINVYPGDGYHWFGDFPRLIHNAVGFAAGESFWIEAGTQLAELAPHWDTTISLTLDATDLIAGWYEAQFVLASNDPLQPEAAIDVTLKVSGEPALATDGDSIDVGLSYVNFPSTTPLRIYNTGSDTLAIIGLASLSPQFSVASQTVRVAPRELFQPLVTFTPSAPGAVSGELVIRSNDPARPEDTVVLWGTGVHPPSIELGRDQLPFELITGEQGYDTIRIANTGLSDLNVEIAVRAAPQSVRIDTSGGGPTGVLPFDEELGRWQPANDGDSEPWPHRPTFRQALEAATSPGDIGVLAWNRFVDHSPGGEMDNTIEVVTAMVPNARIELTGVTDPDSLAVLLADHHVFLVPEQENALSSIVDIGVSWKTVLDGFVRSGGVVIVCGEWGPSNGFLTSTGLMTVTSVGQTSRTTVQIQTPDHPLVAGVRDNFPGTDATRWYNVTNRDATIVGMEAATFGAVIAERRIGLGHVVLLGFDYYSYEDNMAQVLANAVELSTRSLAWLALEPLALTISPDSTGSVVVHVDPTDLLGGDYEAYAVIRSNDPERPVVNVAVGLHLENVPRIAVTPDTLDFGEVYVGYPRTDSIWLANSGPAPLIASGLNSNDEHFIITSGTAQVATDSLRPVGVRFAPDAAGEFSGTLTIISNDPRQMVATVAVRGVGVWPPVAGAVPDSIAFDLPIGSAGETVITLQNNGGSDLVFRVEREITGSGWSHPSPALNDSSRVLLPIDSQWRECAPMPVPVYHATVVAHPNGMVYAIGGYTGEGLYISNTVQIYDPARDEWHFGAPPSGEATGLAAVVGDDGWIYCFRNSTFDAGFKYDVTRDRWARIASPLQVPVPTRAAALGSDGLIYIFGKDTGPVSNAVQVYDPAANVWSWGTSLPDWRAQMTAVRGPGDDIYVLGGSYCQNCIADRTVWIYNVRDDSWRDADSIPTGRIYYGACAGTDQRIYTLGGRQYFTIENGRTYDRAEVYDPLTGAWSDGLSLPQPMSDFMPVSVGSKLFVMGGTDGEVSGKCWSLDLMPWLETSPSEGVIAPGGSVQITVSNRTRDIPPGMYATRLDIVTNDPAQMAYGVPVTLMVGHAADVVLSTDRVDFGDVFIGYPLIRTIWLSNHGSRTLEVSDLGVEGAGFTVLDPVTSVQPGDSVAIRVECRSAGVEPLAGTLRIETNDPDQRVHQVELTGTGLEAPIVSASPGRFAFDLHVGDTGTAQLLIENQGGSDLRWRCDELLFETEAGYTRRTASGWTGYSPFPLWSLDGYRVGMDGFGEQDTILQNEMVTRGAEIVAMQYPMPAGALGSVDVIVLNRGAPLLWDTDIEALHNWIAGGGRMLITYSASNYTTDKLRQLLAGTGIVPGFGGTLGVVVRDLVPHPATTGVDSMLVGLWRTSLEVDPPGQALAFDASDFPVIAAGTLGEGRVIVVSGDLLTALRRSLTGTITFLNRSIDWLVAKELFTIDPQSGTLSPGESASLYVTLDGARRSGYDGAFAVELISNDPATDTLSIPVSVMLSGDAVLVPAEDTTVFRNPGYVGYSVEDAVTIWNRGEGRLEITQVESSNPAFEATQTTVTIPPFDRYDFPLRFSPVDTGTVTTTLSITSNAVNQAVASLTVQATGRFAPRLVVATDTIHVAAESGEYVSRLLPVENQGAGDLEYNVSLEFDYDVASARTNGGLQSAGLAASSGPTRTAGSTTGLKPELAALGQAELADAAEWRYYSGGHMEIGITPAGQIRPVSYPELSSHLSEYHTSGYTAAFYRRGVDLILHTAGWIPAQRMIEVSDSELVNTDRLAVVETVVASLDSALEIRRVITFDKRDRWINIQTSLTNLTDEPLDSVIFKEYADWDVDNAYDSNIWDYDTTRNLVFATQTRAVGTASLNRPAVMDLEGRDDWLVRRSTLSYPVGGERFDGMALHHFDLGTLLPGRTTEVVVAMGVGDNTEDLFHVIDRGLHKLNWLWTDDRSGVVPAGSTKDFAFMLDARWLYAGRYVARALLADNDPELPEVVIPFVFEVSGTPVADVGVDSLDFGYVLVGFPETLYVPIANTGTAALNVIDVQSDAPELSFVSSTLTIQPDHMDTLAVVITAAEHRDVDDMVVLHTDDPAKPEIAVRVRAQTDWPGEAAVAPDSIVLEMPLNDTVHVTLQILNSGQGALRWSVPQFGGVAAAAPVSGTVGDPAPPPTEALQMAGPVRRELTVYQASSGAEIFAAAVTGISHLKLDPVSGSVKPDSKQDIDLRVTTRALGEGYNMSMLRFVTSDPATPEIQLPVNVRMFVPERGDVTLDEQVNESDVIYLNNSLWGRGPDPFDRTGDMDCDRAITITDVMLLFNYVFRGGPPDVCD